MWCNLIYDKYANDHHYNNKLTKNITIKDLNDGSYTVYTNQKARSTFNDKFPNQKLPEFLIKVGMYKLYYYTKVINNTHVAITVVAVNSKILNHYIKHNKDIPNSIFLKRLCQFHHHYTKENNDVLSMFYSKNDQIKKIDGNVNYVVNTVTQAVDYAMDDEINNPLFINNKIKLFRYQKCSIYWMLQKEKSVVSNKQQEVSPSEIQYNLNSEVILNDVYFDIGKHTFEQVHNRKKLKFYGGGLIDEVGLGKTIQMITLSKLNPTLRSYLSNNNKTKLCSRATLILCPNHLCGQWNREFKRMLSDKTKVIDIRTKRHFNKYTYHDILNADFVVVSYTFLDNPAYTNEWRENISTYKNYHRGKWTVSDIKNVQKEFTRAGKELVKLNKNILKQNNVMLHLIHWHRIIIDEFHEIHHNSKYVYIRNMLYFLKSTYKWIMTATPFINNDSLYNTIDFLTDYKNTDKENILVNDKIVNYICTECFRRNTKKSVKNEHTLPPIKEDIKWLNFSSTERIMYNAYLANHNNDKYSIYLRKLCCHPQLADETKHALSNCKTLKDIEKTMVAHYKNEMDNAINKVSVIEKRIQKTQRKIYEIELRKKKMLLEKKGIVFEEGYDVTDSENENEILMLMDDEYGVDYDIFENKTMVTMESLVENLERYKKMKKAAIKIQNGKITTYKFFCNVIERITHTVNKSTKKKSVDTKNEPTDENDLIALMMGDMCEDEDEELCGICMAAIEGNNLGVTVCGHLYCYECLTRSISQYHNCPSCRRPLKNTDIMLLSYERNTEKHNDKENKLIDEIGTKLANLIFYLRENDKHTIIFSQWDDLLMRVGQTLREHKINNVFCKGNCYQRDKAIREFNSDSKIKVIMLSSDSAASGTNLTKASQVILLDPIYGNYDYRKKQEKQAIGRAHRLGQDKNIKVIRFIVKDSIEEEIYKMNIEEDKKHMINKIKIKSDS